MQKNIFLLGPTASGKTELAKSLYDDFPLEIISVDSAQIYKGLDIGTAKLSGDDQEKYPHHLLYWYCTQSLEKLGPWDRDQIVIITVMLTQILMWMTKDATWGGLMKDDGELWGDGSTAIIAAFPLFVFPSVQRPGEVPDARRPAQDPAPPLQCHDTIILMAQTSAPRPHITHL